MAREIIVQVQNGFQILVGNDPAGPSYTLLETSQDQGTQDQRPFYILNQYLLPLAEALLDRLASIRDEENSS